MKSTRSGRRAPPVLVPAVAGAPSCLAQTVEASLLWHEGVLASAESLTQLRRLVEPVQSMFELGGHPRRSPPALHNMGEAICFMNTAVVMLISCQRVLRAILALSVRVLQDSALAECDMGGDGVVGLDPIRMSSRRVSLLTVLLHVASLTMSPAGSAEGVRRRCSRTDTAPATSLQMLRHLHPEFGDSTSSEQHDCREAYVFMLTIST